GCRDRYWWRLVRLSQLLSNPGRSEHALRAREAVLDHRQQRIAHGECRQLLKSRLVARYLKTLPEGALAVDEGAVARAARYDGKYLLRTNTDLDPEAVVAAYKDLWRRARLPHAQVHPRPAADVSLDALPRPRAHHGVLLGAGAGERAPAEAPGAGPRGVLRRGAGRPRTAARRAGRPRRRGLPHPHGAARQGVSGLSGRRAAAAAAGSAAATRRDDPHRVA